MRWKVAEAKQRFSDVVRKAGSAPQLIYNRDKLVAALISPELLEAVESLRSREHHGTPGDALEALHRIAKEERYRLQTPKRKDRRNAMIEALNDLPD